MSTSQEDVVIDEIENMVVPDISVEEVGITSIDNDVWEQNDEDETFVVITSDEKIDDATAEYTENVGGEIEDIGEEQPWNKAYGETESYDSYAVYEEKPDDSIDYPTMVEAVTQNNESGTITSVYYPGAFNNSTDILLEPTTKGVKESIIINEFSTSEYSYTLQLDGLYPELFGNTVLLKDPSGAVSAALSAPYMFDAAGNYNYDIQVSFNAIGNNAFRLTYSMDKSWLESASYPVVIDPTVEYSFDYQNYKFIENAFISSTYPNATAATFAWSEQELTVGPYKYGEARSYFRMAFPDSVIQEMGNGILKDLTLHLYIRYGYGNYSMHQVVGGEWKKSTITWNNAPAFSSNAIDSKYIAGEGWTEWDLTKAASTWFNALDQAGAFGVCMKIDDGGGVCIASSLHDRDSYGYPAYYSITYYKDPSQPVVDVNAYGNGINSGTGYVDLSWTPIDGADNYYIGVFNGKTYEYFYVGNRTSWSTKGKGLWPTESEINDGRFALHADGKGSELPMIPAFTYTNAGGGHEKDLNYYFTVIPANKYGQAPNPSNYSAIKVRLPDTLAPSEAKSVSTSPANFTNSDSITVKWSGIKDYNNIQTDVTTSMGEKGNIQYAIDSSSAWENTDSTDGDGSVVVDISKLEDGKHYVYIRGVDSAGNTGNGRFAVFYVDRTAPSAPKLEIIPDTWTRSDQVSLTWSGIADANELDRIEYSIDGSNFINTGKKEEAYSGYQIDIKSLQSGEHTLMLRAVDAAGNIGDAGNVKIQKDIVPPVFNSATVTPSDWSSEDTLRLEWQSLIDEHSGLKLVWYCIDSTTKTNLDTDKNLLTLINISTLSDGEHRITLHFEDNAGNTEEQILNFYRDTRAPEISLLSPIDECAVSGTVEIIGSIKDLSLENWKVIARSEKGDERTLASGTSAKDAERLAILNCADYDDGEKITIIVEARDKAGNEKRTSGTVVTVDKSSKPILPSVTIEEPEKNSIIESVSALGRYSTQSDTGEKEGFLYIDGIYQGTTRNKSISFDAIKYPENSSHSISIISVAEDETIGYSEGLSSVILLSKVYDEDSTTISETVLPPYPVIALRLHASESVTNESTIIYWYSLDDGANWNAMPLETDIPLLQKPSSIVIKAEAENGASVSGLTLEGITETSPHLVSVKLLRPVDSFELEDKTINSALSELAEEPEGAESLYLFQEEKRVAESFTFDARTNGSGKVALIAMLPENKLLGSGAASEILLRESVDASGTTISDSLTGSGKVYALRLDALNTGNGKFFFSTDGETWTPIALGGYCVLEEAAEKVFVKAEIEEGVLQAWHVEGVVCKESNVRLELVKQPENVTAADWSQYYADRSKWRYDLSWTDPSPEDSSAEYETSYEIYRNGELIATVSETKFSDTEYVANAKYEVRTVRSYGEGYKNQISDKTAAKITTIQPPAKPIGVSYTPEEQNQSEYLDKLYGGNYIFGTEETTPTDDRQLNKALLGRNKYCGYGFEPINFNSGDFILEAEDVTLSDLGLAQFALRRTYNSQSEEKDGPFGANGKAPGFHTCGFTQAKKLCSFLATGRRLSFQCSTTEAIQEVKAKG